MITLDEARRIAYDWHGGGGSPLYSFASTSGHGAPENITPATVKEVDTALAWCERNPYPIRGEEHDTEGLTQLREFLTANMPPDPDDD